MIMALTMLSVIDAVLPCTNYDMRNMDNFYRFARPSVYSSMESNWSYTCNAPNFRGAM